MCFGRCESYAHAPTTEVGAHYGDIEYWRIFFTYLRAGMNWHTLFVDLCPLKAVAFYCYAHYYNEVTTLFIFKWIWVNSLLVLCIGNKEKAIKCIDLLKVEKRKQCKWWAAALTDVIAAIPSLEGLDFLPKNNRVEPNFLHKNNWAGPFTVFLLYKKIISRVRYP